MSQASPLGSARVEALRTLRSWIEGGTLREGASLPPERELAVRLNVGRKPLRWAVQELGKQGLINHVTPKTRIVTRGETPRDRKGAATLLARAVVVLAGERFPGEERSRAMGLGWQFQVIAAALDAVRDAGRNTFKVNASAMPTVEIRELRESGVAGVLVPAMRAKPGQRQRMIEGLLRERVRCVVESDNPFEQDCDRVVPDQAASGYELTRLLLARGRRRILHLDVEGSSWWVDARLSGHRRALDEAGVEPVPTLKVPAWPLGVEHERTQADFEAIARYNLGHLAPLLLGPNRPDAIMCLSDESVSYVAAACRLAGLDPAADVLITGHDNFWHEHWGRQFEPTAPIATADKNNAAIGRAMVEMLLDRPADAPRRRLIPPRLINPRQQPTFSTGATLSAGEPELSRDF